MVSQAMTLCPHDFKCSCASALKRSGVKIGMSACRHHTTASAHDFVLCCLLLVNFMASLALQPQRHVCSDVPMWSRVHADKHSLPHQGRNRCDRSACSMEFLARCSSRGLAAAALSLLAGLDRLSCAGAMLSPLVGQAPLSSRHISVGSMLAQTDDEVPLATAF